MKKEEQKLTPKRNRFNEKYNEFTESEIQKELLFAQQLTIDKLEKIRTNTSNLVWFLIVIPIILGILAVALTS
jgi:ABC-type nickel/cobalt efflux system permease component RcnA